MKKGTHFLWPTEMDGSGSFQDVRCEINSDHLRCVRHGLSFIQKENSFTGIATWLFNLLTSICLNGSVTVHAVHMMFIMLNVIH